MFNSLCMFVFIIISRGNCQDPIVNISNGGLKGVVMKAENGDAFWAFLGIPYATSKRFEDSILLTEKWSNVKNANKYGEPCVQRDPVTKISIGEENCLTINVFTPMNRLKSLKNAEKINLPVIVFIHGDEFSYGSGDQFGPKYILNDYVVLVTFNYRLGIFGFLNTGDEMSVGNFGLKDQTNALNWVNSEISKFGGDRKLITIYGQGSGAASVHYHLLSHMSKGLYSGAIMGSGSALCHWAFDENPKSKLEKIAKYFNCTSAYEITLGNLTLTPPEVKTSHLLKCLKKLNAAELTFDELEESGINWIYEFTFVPSIEFIRKTKGKLDIENAFLIDSPRNIIANKSFNQVPVIFGVNYNEGILFTSEIIKNENLTELSVVLPTKILQIIHKNESLNEGSLLKFRRHYFGHVEQIPKELTEENAFNLTSVFTHINWIDCTRDAAILHTKMHSMENPVYFYSFDYDGDFYTTGLNESSQVLEGPAHGDELRYIFNNERNASEDILQNEWNKEISEDILAWWISFARYRDPNPITMLGKGIDWNPATVDELKVFKIANSSSHLIDDPYESAASFLHSL